MPMKTPATVATIATVATVATVASAPLIPITKPTLHQRQDLEQLEQTPRWKEQLPSSLKCHNSLQKIRLGNTDIFMLGTAHVSNVSSAEAKVLLEHVRPDCIFVELCDARIALLEGEQDSDGEENNNNCTSSKNPAKTPFWEQVRHVQLSQGASRLQAMSTVLLTSIQEDYANDLGVELGGEFRQAYTYWRQQGSRRPYLVLGDRPLHLTLVRAWESLWWWPKIKVILGLLWSSFLGKPKPEEIRAWLDSVMQQGSDVLTTSLNELRQHFPTLYTSIIAERDAWLAAKLVQTCRALQSSSRPSRLVCIVGAGHVPGVCEWLTHPPSKTSPEEVLANISTTRRWANDPVVQSEVMPRWIYEVTQLQEPITPSLS